jgi:hypothetical protein
MKLPLNSRRYHPPSLSTPLLHNHLLAAEGTRRGDSVAWRHQRPGRTRTAGGDNMRECGRWIRAATLILTTAAWVCGEYREDERTELQANVLINPSKARRHFTYNQVQH